MSVSRPYEEEKAILRAHLCVLVNGYSDEPVRAGERPEIEVDLPTYGLGRIARILELAKKLPFVEAEFILKQYGSDISEEVLRQLRDYTFGENAPTHVAVTRVVREESAEEKEHHQKLYIKAYQDQEVRNSRRSAFETGLAIAAFILPPLSLIYTIKHYARTLQRDKLSSEKMPAKWHAAFIIIMIVSAIVPVISGLVSLTAMNNARENRNPLLKREKDIVKTTHYLVGSETHKPRKNHMIDVDRKELQNVKNKITKPRKVVVKPVVDDEAVTTVYSDKYQDKRHRAYIFGMYPARRDETGYFTESYKKSAALVENLEQKYRK